MLVTKWQNDRNKIFVLFPQNVSLPLSASADIISKIGSFGKELTPSHTSPGFYMSAVQVF